MRWRILLLAAASTASGACLIAIAMALPHPDSGVPRHDRRGTAPPRKSPSETPRQRGERHASGHGFLAFLDTPRHPGNLVERAGVAGRSAARRPIRLRQLGDPALPGKVLLFGCIHGDECAATGQIQPLANGCPDPAADIYIVPNLDPDGFAPTPG